MSMESHMKKYYGSMLDGPGSGSPRRSPRKAPQFKGFRKKKKVKGDGMSGTDSMKRKETLAEIKEDSIKQLQEFGTIDSRAKEFNEYEQPDPGNYSLKTPKRGRDVLRNNDPHSQSLRQFRNGNLNKSPRHLMRQENAASQKVFSVRDHYGHRFERSPKPVQSTRSHKHRRQDKQMKNSSSTRAVKGLSLGKKNKNPKVRAKSGLKTGKPGSTSSRKKLGNSQRKGSRKKLGNSGTGGSLKGSYVSIEMQRQVVKKKKEDAPGGKKRSKVIGRHKSKQKFKKDPPIMNFSKKNKEEKINVHSKSNLQESELISEQRKMLSLSELKPRLNQIHKNIDEKDEEIKILDYFTRENQEFLQELNSKFENKYENEFKDFLFKFEKPIHLESNEAENPDNQALDKISYDYDKVFLGESIGLVGTDVMDFSQPPGNRNLWNERQGKGLGLNFLGEQIEEPGNEHELNTKGTVQRIKQEFEQKKLDMVKILMSREPEKRTFLKHQESREIEAHENSQETHDHESVESEQREDQKEEERMEDIFDRDQCSQESRNSEREESSDTHSQNEDEQEIEITTETDIGVKRHMINSNHFETDSQTLKNTQTEFSMTETERIKPIEEEAADQQPIVETDNDFEGFQSDYKDDKISLESVELEAKDSLTEINKNKVYSIGQKSQDIISEDSPHLNSPNPEHHSNSNPTQLKTDSNAQTQKTHTSSAQNENLSQRTGRDTRRESEMIRSKHQISVNTQDLQYSDGIEDYDEEYEDQNIPHTELKKNNYPDKQNNNNQERSQSVDASMPKPLKRMSNTMDLQKIQKEVQKKQKPESDSKFHEDEEESDLYDFDDMENDEKFNTREMKDQLMEYELEMNMLALEISRGGSSFEGSDLASNDEKVDDREAFPGVKPIRSKQNIFFQDSPMVSKTNSQRGSIEVKKNRQILESEIVEADNEGNIISKPGNRLTFASQEVYKLGIKERNEDSETEEDHQKGKVIEELDEVAGIRIMIRDKPKDQMKQGYEEVDDTHTNLDQNDSPDAGQDRNPKMNIPEGNDQPANFEFRRHTFSVPDGDQVQDLIADLQSFGGSGLKQMEGSMGEDTEDNEQSDPNPNILSNSDNQSDPKDKHNISSDDEPMEAIGEESESEVDINALKEKIKTKTTESGTSSRRYSRYSQDPETRETYRKTSTRVTETEMMNQNSFGDIKDLVNTLSQNMDLTQEALIEESFQMFTDKDQEVNAKQFDNTGQLGFIDAIQVLDAQEESGDDQEVYSQTRNSQESAAEAHTDKVIQFKPKAIHNHTSESRERRTSSGVNVSNLKNETEDENNIPSYKQNSQKLKVNRMEFDSVNYKKWKGKDSETEESLNEKNWREKLRGKGVFMSQQDEMWKASLNSKIEEKEENDETLSNNESDIATSESETVGEVVNTNVASSSGLPQNKVPSHTDGKNQIKEQHMGDPNKPISIEEMVKRGNEIRQRVMSQPQNQPNEQPSHPKINTRNQNALIQQENLIAQRLLKQNEESAKDEAIQRRLEEVRQINRDSKPFLELACQPQNDSHRKHSELKESEIYDNELSCSKLKDEYGSLRDSDYDLSKSRITPERRDSDLNDRKGSYDPMYRQNMLRNLSGPHESPRNPKVKQRNLFKDETSAFEESESGPNGHPINFETHGKGIADFQKRTSTEHDFELGGELEEYVSEDESKEIDKLDIFASNMDNEPPSKQQNELEHSEVIHESQLKRELDKKYGTNTEQEQKKEQKNDDQSSSLPRDTEQPFKAQDVDPTQVETDSLKHRSEDQKQTSKLEDNKTQQSESLGGTHLLTGDALEFELKYNEILKKTFLRKIMMIQRAWRDAIQQKYQKRDSQGPMDINDIFDRFLTIKQKVAEQKGLSAQERLNLVENEYFAFLRRLELQNRDKKLLKQLLNSLFFLSKKLEIYPDQELAY